MIVGLNELNRALWGEVVKLYLRNPLRHVYLVYDLIYDLDVTEAYFSFRGVGIDSYLLIWRGLGFAGNHLWGSREELVELLPTEASLTQLHESSLLSRVVNRFKGLGEVSVSYYIDMAVSEDAFTPHEGLGVVKLTASHAEAFAKLRGVQGRPVTIGRARELLERLRCYGVFKGGELVSTACACVRMPEVWVICNVFTHPEHRCRGYAKAVATAVTRDAVTSGAKALLHVAEGNEAALRVYRALGYRELCRRPWVSFKP